MNSSTIGIPNIWAQYMNNKDCTQGFCSLYCPQWCRYFIFPPPPPPAPHDYRSSGRNISPLIITTIGILIGALLLVSYYAIIFMYCRKRFSSTTASSHDRNNVDLELGGVHQPPVHEPWFVATNGLDEALIKSIAMFEYKRGDGLVDCSDCMVCLTEFVEDEKLRLLPQCSHAFHVQCIDAWLKSHSNCPLCRANVAAGSTPSLTLHLSENELSSVEVDNNDVAGSVEIDMRNQESEETSANGANTPASGWRERDEEGNRGIRRSVSMDFLFVKNREEMNRERSRICCEMRHGVMKRSHSSGRWFYSKCGKTHE